jgi:hypothetical protein
MLGCGSGGSDASAAADWLRGLPAARGFAPITVARCAEPVEGVSSCRVHGAHTTWSTCRVSVDKGNVSGFNCQGLRRPAA